MPDQPARPSDSPVVRYLSVTTMRPLAKYLLLLAVLTFISCLQLDAVVFDRTCPGPISDSRTSAPVAGLGNKPLGTDEPIVNSSFFILLLGGFSLLTGLGGIGWLANPLAALAALFLLLKDARSARSAAVAAFLLAGTSLHATNFLYLAGDEGAVCRISAISALPGFWVWLSSMALLLTATVFGVDKRDD